MAPSAAATASPTWCASATRNTTRLRALVEDLLTLSSVDAGAGTPHRPLGVTELLHAAVETVDPAAA